MSLASKGKPKSETHKKHLRDNHKTKSVHTIVFKDGHTEDTTDSITTIAKRFGISEFNVLIRHSAKEEFINGIYLLGIYEGNYACTKSYKSKLLTYKYQDPIKGDICSYRALYSRIHYGKNKDKYKEVDLYNCIIKEKKNEV